MPTDRWGADGPSGEACDVDAVGGDVLRDGVGGRGRVAGGRGGRLERAGGADDEEGAADGGEEEGRRAHGVPPGIA